MKEFLFIFRRDAVNNEWVLSPEKMQAMMENWQNWMGGIAAQNKLASRGSRLEPDGKVVRSNVVVTDGPYVETKEAIGGYIIIREESLEKASEIAKGCPIFLIGGNVEVRAVFDME